MTEKTLNWRGFKFKPVPKPEKTLKTEWECVVCGSKKKASYKDVCKSCYNKGWFSKEYQANASRKYAHNNKNMIRKKAKRAYKRNKKQALVRARTNHNNEKTGKCGNCEKVGKTEFHHLSYTPNIFEELCRRCHNERHGRELHVIE